MITARNRSGVLTASPFNDGSTTCRPRTSDCAVNIAARGTDNAVRWDEANGRSQAIAAAPRATHRSSPPGAASSSGGLDRAAGPLVQDGPPARRSVPAYRVGRAGDLLLEPTVGLDARRIGSSVRGVRGVGLVGGATCEAPMGGRGLVCGRCGLVGLDPCLAPPAVAAVGR